MYTPFLFSMKKWGNYEGTDKGRGKLWKVRGNGADYEFVTPVYRHHTLNR